MVNECLKTSKGVWSVDFLDRYALPYPTHFRDTLGHFRLHLLTERLLQLFLHLALFALLRLDKLLLRLFVDLLDLFGNLLCGRRFFIRCWHWNSGEGLAFDGRFFLLLDGDLFGKRHESVDRHLELLVQFDFYALAWPNASLRLDHSRVIVSVRICRQYCLCIPGIFITFLISVHLFIDSSLGVLLKDTCVCQFFLPQFLFHFFWLLAIFKVFFMDDLGGFYIWKELLCFFIAEFFSKVHEPSLFILDELIACIV